MVDFLKQVYIFSDEDLRMKLRNKILDSYENLKYFARRHNIKYKTLYTWFEKDSRIPLWFIVYLLGDDFYSYLNNYSLVSKTSNYILKINSNMTIIESGILGWILSEGHLEKNKISIAQGNKEVLLRLKAFFESNYGEKCGANIYPDKDNFKLVLPTIFSFYFSNRFLVPLGKKSYKIEVPKEIKCGDSYIQYSFLTAYIEGDGSFTHNITEYLKQPRISITTTSQELAEGLKELLIILGYTPKIYKCREEIKVCLHKSDEISKFYFYSFGYMIHHEKRKRLEKYLSQPYLLKTILVDGRKITKKFRNKVGSWKMASLSLNNLGFKKSYLTIKNWGLGYFRPSLDIVLTVCDFLKLNYFQHIPKHYAGLLYLHNKITYLKLVEIKNEL